MFNRQAWVGLSGNWGEVRLGRQNSPVFYDQGYLDAFGAATQASGFSNLMTYVVRTSNTVSYQSPVIARLAGRRLCRVWRCGRIALGRIELSGRPSIQQRADCRYGGVAGREKRHQFLDRYRR